MIICHSSPRKLTETASWHRYWACTGLPWDLCKFHLVAWAENKRPDWIHSSDPVGTGLKYRRKDSVVDEVLHEGTLVRFPRTGTTVAFECLLRVTHIPLSTVQRGDGLQPQQWGENGIFYKKNRFLFPKRYKKSTEFKWYCCSNCYNNLTFPSLYSKK